MKKTQELNRDVIKCANIRTFKAYLAAFDDCKTAGALKQVVRVTPIRKAKHVVVEYAGDSWAKDAAVIGCCLNIA